MMQGKNAIALLITMFFIIAITVAIGIGLKQVNKAGAYVESEQLLLQSSMIFDDVLAMLKDSKELDYLLDDNNLSGDVFNSFLVGYSIPGIPLGDSGVIMSVELNSARSKININSFVDNNESVEVLREYLNYYMVNSAYADMILDATSGIKLDDSYRTGLFYENPQLYRDYIVSDEQLEEINAFYMKTYGDNNLQKLNIPKLFYFGERKEEYKVDLNCATPEVLEMMLRDKNRALSLFPVVTYEEDESAMDVKNLCSSSVCNSLTKDEKEELKKYNATCKIQPYLDVVVEVMQKEQTAKISFEYDMKKKKGYNFVYEI